MDPVDSQPQVSDYLAVVWRRRLIILVVVVAAVAAAATVSFLQTPLYRASAEVLVSRPPTLSSLTGASTSTEGMQDELAVAKGASVVGPVEEAFDDADLGLSVSASGSVMTFSAVSADPEVAAEAAERYVEEFVTRREVNRLDQFARTAGVLQERINLINLELEELRGVPSEPGSIEAARISVLTDQRQTYLDLRDSLVLSGELSEGAGVEVVQPAKVPTTPFEPATRRNLALALLVGLVLGTALAFLRESLDTTLRTDRELEAATGLASLGVVPDLSGWKNSSDSYLVARQEPRSAAAESYRGLRTSLQFLAIDRQLECIQVTSARPFEGKSTSAANLAVVCARAGQQVVLVDCDLRRPRVHSFFDLDANVGFTTVLLGAASLDEVATQIPDEPGLTVIPAGRIPPDPSELLSGLRAREIFAELRRSADLVIIDTPPVLAVSDPVVVSGLVDGVVLVASAGTSHRGSVRRAADQLRAVEAPMLGTLLNRFSERRAGGRYGSGYGYGYGYGYGSYGTYGTYSPMPLLPRSGTAPAGAEGIDPHRKGSDQA
jgi:capsular exopolysaccharide synthesis family protein